MRKFSSVAALALVMAVGMATPAVADEGSTQGEITPSAPGETGSPPQAHLSKDARGDVATEDSRGSAETVPGEKSADIRRLFVSNGASHVSARARVRDLTEAPARTRFEIRSSTRTYRLTTTHRDGTSISSLLDQSSGEVVDCPDVVARFDTRRDVVALRVPADCLRSSTKVRVGLVLTTGDIDQLKGGAAYWDFAFLSGSSDATDTFPLSPWLKRAQKSSSE